MSKFIVGYINFFDNKLKVELIEAKSWKEALSKHSLLIVDTETPDDLSWLPDDMKEAKFEAFNADFAFDVKEVKE